MGSPYLEQQQRKREGKSQVETEPVFSPPAKPRTASTGWWKLLFIPFILQVFVWFGAKTFLSQFWSGAKTESFKFDFSGLIASVPEDFPQALIPQGFAVQQTMQQNQQTTLIGEAPMNSAEFLKWLRASAQANAWKIDAQLSSPQGIVLSLSWVGTRCDIVVNELPEQRVQLLYTLSSPQ